MQTTVETQPSHTGRFVTITRSYRTRGFRMQIGESIDCEFDAFVRDGREPMLVLVEEGQKLPVLSTERDGKLYACAYHEGAPYAVLLLDDTWL